MSLILKGIDMPKCSNEDIVVVIRRDKAEVWQTGVKERTVEAIQIPTPHGRLIDGDELINDLRIYESKYCGEQGYITQDDIIDAPTIIDAEE